MKKIFIAGCLFLFFMLVIINTSYAFPNLQVYIDASDTEYIGDNPDPWLHESWHSCGNDFDVWVIAAKRDIDNVKLVMAVPEGETGYITVTPFGGSSITYFSASHFANGTPGPLSPHGIYDTDYALHTVGNMILGPDTVYNMVDDPNHNEPKQGKIAKFHVERVGFTGVHFDAYGDGGVFAPYSHDAQVAPEPTSMALLGIGLFGFGVFKRRK